MVEDYQESTKSISNVCFSFVRRFVNSVAHSLARVSVLWLSLLLVSKSVRFFTTLFNGLTLLIYSSGTFYQGCQTRTGPAGPTGKTGDRAGNRSG